MRQKLLFFALGFVLLVLLGAHLNTGGRCGRGAACSIGDSGVLSLGIVTDGGEVTLDGTIGSNAQTLGWTRQTAANTACSSTCVSACVMGINSAILVADFVDCADATADVCLCAGAL